MRSQIGPAKWTQNWARNLAQERPHGRRFEAPGRIQVGPIGALSRATQNDNQANAVACGATQNDESGQRLVAAAVIVQCVAQGFKLRSFLSCNCSGVALQGHFTFIAFAKHEHFLVIMRAKSFNKQAATSRYRPLPPLKRGRPEAIKRGRK